MQSLHLFFLLLFITANSSVVFGGIISNYANKIKNHSPSNHEKYKMVKTRQVAESTITVDQNGHGNFETIQAAIDSVPSGNTEWVRIVISPGTYVEKVTIPRDKPYVYLKGVQGRHKTFVTYNDHQSTDTSATFTSSPDYVAVQGITFMNSFNIARNYRYSRKGNNEIKQALAARIYGDKSMFVGCGFLGFQDTLWDARGRHFYKNCYIQGAIDFIFGSAKSFFENSLLNVTIGELGAGHVGYITAQGREASDENSGFVFYGGSVFGSGKVLLGRAYGPYSTVIFHGTSFGPLIAPQGWDAWNYRGQEKRFIYGEIKCGGPGSDTSKRVPWEEKLSDSDIPKYSRSSFIDQDQWISKFPY